MPGRRLLSWEPARGPSRRRSGRRPPRGPSPRCPARPPADRAVPCPLLVASRVDVTTLLRTFVRFYVTPLRLSSLEARLSGPETGHDRRGARHHGGGGTD